MGTMRTHGAHTHGAHTYTQANTHSKNKIFKKASSNNPALKKTSLFVPVFPIMAMQQLPSAGAVTVGRGDGLERWSFWILRFALEG